MIIIIIFFHNHVYKKSQLEMYNPEGIAMMHSAPIRQHRHLNHNEPWYNHDAFSCALETVGVERDWKI